MEWMRTPVHECDMGRKTRYSQMMIATITTSTHHHPNNNNNNK